MHYFLKLKLDRMFWYDDRLLGSVWYMCLKTENCCLKIFIEIRVSEKVYGNV